MALPLAYHILETIPYAYGGYDGTHCAGLLDAVSECSKLEYYLDWVFGFFGTYSLIIKYMVGAGIALVLLVINHFVNQKAKNENEI